MVALRTEQVLDVHHWSDGMLSIRTTRAPSFRFESGHFVMVGLEVGGKPLLRAYSIVSAAYEDTLEFLSIKIPDGPLTSRLQHLQPGDSVLMSNKPVGTLVVRDLNPGANLYLFATGTGLAPFLSITRDPETYERFEKVVLVHGVRRVVDLAYGEYIERRLPDDEFLGEMVREKLIYYPTVTREPFRNTGRITQHIADGSLTAAIGLPPLDPARDRAMICGGPEMLVEISRLLDDRGFVISPSSGHPGDYVIERAFVEK